MTSRTQSETFSPAKELSARRAAPECLYVVVDDVAFATIDHEHGSVVIPPSGDFRAKLSFTCEDLKQSNLRTHLIHSNCPALSTRFISVFEDERVALEAHPFCRSGTIRDAPTRPPATKLIVDTSRLKAGWIDTLSGRIQVWLEHGDLPMVPKGVLYLTAEAIGHFDASIWICLDEVREIFDLKPDEGEKGEWLACGFIPRSMVAAQVVMQNYQRRPDMAHRVPDQSGLPNRNASIRSIRSISSQEQEEHIRVQILRNKASREEMRAKAASKKHINSTEQPLLRQAVRNRQRALKEDVRSEVIEIPLDAHLEPRQRATFLPSSTRDLMRDSANSSRYASVRSPKLREALERRQAMNSDQCLPTRKTPQLQCPQVLIEKHMDSPPPSMSAESLNPGCVGEEPSDQQNIAVVVHLCEPSLYKGSDDDSASRNFETLPVISDPDENSDSLPHSERLRRARAGKQSVGSYALGDNPRLEAHVKIEVRPGSKEETGNLLNSAVGMSDVESVLDELAQTKFGFTIPEPPLLSHGESTSGDAPSMTDEDPLANEKAAGCEADISDNQSSASEPAHDGRTRRRSPHSRLTTPLGMYDSGPRTPTIG